MARFWRWLLPGLFVKRWFLLFVVGVLLMGFGLSLTWGGRTLYSEMQWFLQARLWRTSQWLQVNLAIAGVLSVLIGLTTALYAAYRLARSLMETLHPQLGAAQALIERRQTFRGPRVVAVGGGTGIPNLLRGLKEYTANLSAVVTVADDGGSSGRLRDEFGILPPGDIRNCLVALADTEPLMEKLFQYRFDHGDGLTGHSFGNLFILALTKTTGNFYDAIRSASQVLAVRGQVLPSTLQQVGLEAELTDGRRVTGESRIAVATASVQRVSLLPSDPEALPEAVSAIRNADVVVLGPGSLYTSVIPNVLVPGVAAAIRQSAAIKFFVCNIMTQPGETNGYTAADHVRAVLEHAGHGLIDVCVVNSSPISEVAQARYAEQGAAPVAVDVMALQQLGVEVLAADILDAAELVRHHPGKVTRAILGLAARRMTRRGRSPWDILWLRQRLKQG